MSDIEWNKINTYVNKDNETLLEYRNCPICNANDYRTIITLNNFQFFSDSRKAKQVDINQQHCRECGALYMNPCYSNIGFERLFEEAGQSYGSSLKHTQEQINWLNDYKLLDDNARVLDVGCYDGNFLSRLPDNVIKLGVDIDEQAIKRGREKYKEHKIEFFHGDFENFSFEGESPNTITMFHLLEHLPRPIEALKKLYSISNESTKLVIEVPILEKGKTNDINSFFSVQHMTHFSRNSLFNCLSQAGWNIELCFETEDYNGYRVLATIKNNLSLTYQLKYNSKDWTSLNESLSFWYSSIKDVEKFIYDLTESKKIVIWGGGAHTEFMYQVSSLFHSHCKTLFIIIDSDPIKHGTSWRGINIYEPSVIMDLDWSSTKLLISSYGGQKAIFEAALKLGVPSENIVKIYETTRVY